MSDTITLFGMRIDRLDRRQAVDSLLPAITRQPRQNLLVVTPNVDHVIRYQDSADFRETYHRADRVLADGKPVVWASRILGKSLPETVPGSDLVPLLFDASLARELPVTAFLLGGMEGVAERAAAVIREKWPTVSVVGTYSPPFGFEKDPEELNRIIAMVNDSNPDMLVVGLGSPKQELWASSHKDRLSTGAILCVGATIDFLAGEKSRAPIFFQKIGAEWLYRMCQEPGRLAKRYMSNLAQFPWLFLKELFK